MYVCLCMRAQYGGSCELFWYLKHWLHLIKNCLKNWHFQKVDLRNDNCLVFVFKLSDPSDLPRNAFRIFTILVEFLCIEHIDYALETGLAGKYICVTLVLNSFDPAWLNYMHNVVLDIIISVCQIQFNAMKLELL